MRSNEDLIFTVCQLIKNYMSNILKEKFAEDVHQKLVPDLYLILVNIFKYSQSIQESLLWIIYFKKELCKIFKKFNFAFGFWTRTLFLDIIVKYKRSQEVVVIPFQVAKCFQNFLSLVVYHFNNFNALILGHSK